MYAIIKTGGKQYKVQEGDILRVEKIEAPEGQEIEFDEVLMMRAPEDDTFVVQGEPLKKAKVLAEVVRHGRDKKVLVGKSKKRKKYRRKKGHRQSFTEVKIHRLLMETQEKEG